MTNDFMLPEAVQAYEDGWMMFNLRMSVPVFIRQLRNCGGPDESDKEQARKVVLAACEPGIHGRKGLPFGGAVSQEKRQNFFWESVESQEKQQKSFWEFVESIAVLAFCPGGVTLCGVHFEAEAQEASL